MPHSGPHFGLLTLKTDASNTGMAVAWLASDPTFLSEKLLHLESGMTLCGHRFCLEGSVLVTALTLYSRAAVADSELQPWPGDGLPCLSDLTCLILCARGTCDSCVTQHSGGSCGFPLRLGHSLLCCVEVFDSNSVPPRDAYSVSPSGCSGGTGHPMSGRPVCPAGADHLQTLGSAVVH